MGLSIFIVMICLLEFFQLSVIKQRHNFYNHLVAVCLPTAIILTHFAKRIARTVIRGDEHLLEHGQLIELLRCSAHKYLNTCMD